MHADMSAATAPLATGICKVPEVRSALSTIFLSLPPSLFLSTLYTTTLHRRRSLLLTSGRQACLFIKQQHRTASSYSRQLAAHITKVLAKDTGIALLGSSISNVFRTTSCSGVCATHATMEHGIRHAPDGPENRLLTEPHENQPANSSSAQGTMLPLRQCASKPWRLPYDPLNQERNEIRLLTILPGKWSSEVCCTLKTVSMDDNPAYYALSYVWGDPGDTVVICVDGQPFQATRNLWYALRRLRRETHPRIFWIDAICINQDNDEEKSHQVANMGSVFRSCCEAFLFLGECQSCVDSDADEQPQSYIALKAFELIGLFESNKHFDEIPCFEKTSESQLDISKEYEDHFAALDALNESSWWYRIWVVQETALPKKARFVWASEDCAFESVASAASNFRTHRNTCCQRPSSSERKYVLNSLYSQIRPMMWARDRTRDSSRITIASLRRLCVTRKASNRRDLVYGLLGLVNDWSYATSPILPDYSGSLEHCFATIFLSFTTYHLSSALLGRRAINMIEKLPTWVPDWIASSLPSEREYEYLVQCQISGLFKCSGSITSTFTLVSDSLLMVKGVRLQRLKDVGDHSDLKNSSPSFDDVIQEWMKMVGVEVFPTSRHKKQKAKAFWRTVIQDFVSKGFSSDKKRRAQDTDYDNFQEKQKVSFLDGFGTARPTRRQTELCIWRKAMFITEEDNLGLADEEAAPLDEVYLILGCNMPFLLRRTGQMVKVDGSSDPLPSFTVIGDCYMDGYMDGEGLSEGWEDRVETIALV